MGLKYSLGKSEGIDRHPGTLPGTKKQFVKLIAAKDSQIIMGGEVNRR